MTELYYDSFPVAYFIVSQEMGSRKQFEFLEDLYRHEYAFLHPAYREHKKEFISDVLYWTDYLLDKEKLDKEFPAVERDFKAAGQQFVREKMMSDYPEFDLFFMIMRLRILYAEEKPQVRMKLRTLLKHYGYKRRSDSIVSHMEHCMTFYHIMPYLKGYVPCAIKDINLDDMITFRVS